MSSGSTTDRSLTLTQVEEGVKILASIDALFNHQVGPNEQHLYQKPKLIIIQDESGRCGGRQLLPC